MRMKDITGEVASNPDENRPYRAVIKWRGKVLAHQDAGTLADAQNIVGQQLRAAAMARKRTQD